MKKIIKSTLKVLKYLSLAIVAFLAINTIFHHAMLKLEQDKIVPNGQIVEVNSHDMHVYAEGNSDNPTLVFMSGSATVDPVYDFKPLYSRLSNDFHIVVVEKAGYGYSEIYDTSRDIDIMLSETKEALSQAGENPPYILLPHSMSGIEALYWAQQYPDEISAIIGLDMALPDTYEDFDFDSSDKIFALGQAAVFMGLHRTFCFAYPHFSEGLTKEETKQQKYLIYRNAVNQNYLDEGKYIYDNAALVKDAGTIDTPSLFFVSDGKGLGEYWYPSYEAYANETNSQVIYLDCGHYIHHFESEKIAEGIIRFINSLAD